VSGNPSFRELLRRVRETALQAHAHQDLPFEQLVDALNPKRNLNRNPLFQVMFALQNAPLGELRTKDLLLELLPNESMIAKFDLGFTLTETEAELEGVIDYALDLFDPETIDFMVMYYQRMLEQAVEAPHVRLSKIKLLSAKETEQLIYEENQTAIEYPQSKLIQLLFEEQVERTPAVVAVECGSQSMSYAELNARANQLAHYLRQFGIGPESKVGICMERCPELMVALLGVLKAGGAYVPMDPSYPVDRLAFMLEDAQILVLLTMSSLHERLPAMAAVVIELDEIGEKLADQSCDNPQPTTSGGNAAYVIYTSGSTGKPKGVVVTQAGLTNYLLWAGLTYSANGSLVAPLHSSIGFDLTVTSLYLPLLHGSRIVLFNDKIGVQELIDVFDESRRFDLLKLTPSHLDLISPSVAGGQPRLSVGTLVIGGEALSYSQVAAWRQHSPATRLINEYGPTETVVGCCVYEVATDDLAAGNIPIGKPIANMAMYVLDEEMEPVPVGFAGEIYIGGIGLAQGYLKRPALTAERFVPNPFGKLGGERLYRTGDLGHWCRGGNIEYLGRIDEQIKILGYRIEPGEIESALREYPGIRDAVVVAREDSSSGKRLVAYLMPDKTSDIEVPVLREILRNKLPAHMVPAAFVVLEAIPLTANGKIDRAALPRPELQDLNRTTILPQTQIEHWLADLWQQELKISNISIDDSFFDLGGNSLSLVRMHSLLIESGKVTVSLIDLFRYPTIRSLARFLENPGALSDTVAQGQARGARQREAMAARVLARRAGND